MSSPREQILGALRTAAVEPSPLLPLTGPWLIYENALVEFCGAVERAAGSWLEKQKSDDLETALSSIGVYKGERRVCSLVEGVARHNVDLKRVSEPHRLESVDVAIVRAELGVAENGAVWVTAETAVQRALLFLSQHLIVLLAVQRIVHNLHEAYGQLHPEDRVFGCFISGPSKTADIEQSLVIGAHGPRSLTVVLIA